MEWRRTIPPLLVVTGVANILLLKWADQMQSTGVDGVLRGFQHPFIQTGCLFFGQFLCFIVFEAVTKLIRRRQQDASDEQNILTLGNEDYSIKIFVVPAICELIASILLFSGLYYTSASSYSMLQCAVPIFVGIYGAIYLNQTLTCDHWVGVLFIAVGAGLIMIHDYAITKSNTVLTGDLLILCSVIFHGLKYVQEEKHIKVLDIPPLRAIGWQGVFGMTMMALLYIPLNFLKASEPFGHNSHGVVEDFVDAMAEMGNNFWIVLLHCLFIVSVAIYSYCGVFVTKEYTAMARVFNTFPIALIVWLIACIVQWEIWYVVTFIIFLVILTGGWIYRNFNFVSFYRHILRLCSRRRESQAEPQVVTSQPADVI